MPPALPVLAFDAVRHEFSGPGGAALRVLDGISFDVPAGRFVSVIGPSGCGKSTLLGMAAGLIRPSGGQVRHAGRPVAGINTGVGLVPQSAGLLPWKTLAENVAFPLDLRGVKAAERRARVDAALAAVDLAGFGAHYPHSLSGGMQKRAAIARTLVYRPDVILMDEPFGALDAQTRMAMQADLQSLAVEQGATVLLVTHDIAEAVLLSDSVVVLGRRPARVLARVEVALPRPRDVFAPHANPGFAEAYDAVWSAFRAEVADGARPPRRAA